MPEYSRPSRGHSSSSFSGGSFPSARMRRLRESKNQGKSQTNPSPNINNPLLEKNRATSSKLDEKSSSEPESTITHDESTQYAQLEKKQPTLTDNRFVALEQVGQQPARSQLEPKTEKPNKSTSEPKIATSIATGEQVYQQKDYQTAYSIFLAIVSQQPDNLLANFYLSVSANEIGKPDKAIAATQKLIKSGYRLAQAHYFQGIAYEKLGNKEQASLSYQQAAAEIPDAKKAFMRLEEEKLFGLFDSGNSLVEKAQTRELAATNKNSTLKHQSNQSPQQTTQNKATFNSGSFEPTVGALGEKTPSLESTPAIVQFKAEVQNLALTQLQENNQLIDRAREKYQNADPSILEGLKKAEQLDNKLAPVQLQLEKTTTNLETLIGQGEANYRVYLNRGNTLQAQQQQQTNQERTQQLERQKQNLNNIITARAVLLQEHPAIGVIKDKDVRDSNSHTQLKQKIETGFQSLLSDIAQIEAGIVSGDVPLVELDAVVAQAKQDIESPTDRKQIETYLARKQRQKTAISLGATAIELGLTIAAFCTGGIPGLVLGGIGTIFGIGTAAYELERIDDINRVARASQAGGNTLVGDPEQAKQDYIFAWANLVLNLAMASLDVGVTFVKGANQLNPAQTADELASIPNSDALFRIPSEELIKIQKAVDGDAAAKEGLEAIRGKYGSDVDEAIAVFENSDIRVANKTESLNGEFSARLEATLGQTNPTLRKEYLEIVHRDIEKSLELLELSNFGTPERFENVFNALDSVDDVKRLKQIYNDSYLDSLGDEMASRYRRLLNDIADGNPPPVAEYAKPLSLSERLEILDKTKDIKTELALKTSDAPADVLRKMRIGQRNIAYGSYNIELPNGEKVIGSFVSRSGKTSAKGADLLEYTGETMDDGRIFIPDFPKKRVSKFFEATEDRGANDSERKAFEYILGQIKSKLAKDRVSFKRVEEFTGSKAGMYQGQGFSGKITINSEMTPCRSCENILVRQFREYFGSDITVEVKYGVEYKNPRR